MHYSVKITPQAILQIQEAVTYITSVLMVPDTAKAWLNYLEKEISGLNSMPERFPFTEYEPWKTRGYHKMPVKNFIVYYYVDKKDKTVWVTAVVYGKRDQLNALRNIPGE